MVDKIKLNTLKNRFQGYYPVIIDVETSGFNAQTNALLEIAAITLQMNEEGWLICNEILHFHVQPFEGAILEEDALKFNRIKEPKSLLRGAISEQEALNALFKKIKIGLKHEGCRRAVIVAHNAYFDHSFIMAAAKRSLLEKNPFHPFVTFDTAALSGLVLGQTILAKACIAAQIGFDNKRAHSALYDTKQTAILFCELVNRWKRLGGWPLPSSN
ncbi:ribonuclease T [Candidatus Fukatsuia anoeciicola]|uniref:ribonuclease T n=1 Tax=Candidatus Fukatsuia anoeciicola TaxID=2994492 RepID=UPI00346419DC